MSIVPTKLPSVPIDVNRPTFPPTPDTEDVITRTRNGPVIASNASGTKNKIIDASNEPTASRKSRHQYATGLQINTVMARYAAAASIAQYRLDNSCLRSANRPDRKSTRLNSSHT